MNLDQYTAQMTANAQVIRQLTADIQDEQARWRPDPESWSVLEVINHLYDEEQLDFRVRIDHVLHKPGIDPPRIDPAKWVMDHAYNERNLAASVKNFLQERETSIRWLHDLESPDWDAVYNAPWGIMRAGDFFASWVAHDLLHMRQLIELQYLWTQEQIKPYDPAYAGEW